MTSSTVAGADDCATSGATYDLRRSCVRLCPTTTQSYTLWIRAWNRSTQGTAWVLAQRVSSSTATPGTSICGGPGDPIQLGCWTALTYSLSFGGVSRRLTSTLTPVQFETAELPGSTGSNPGAHAIVISGDNNDVGSNWDMRPNAASGFNGATFSHRSYVSGAQLTSADASSLFPPAWNAYTVTGGAVSAAGAGPLRLLQNDYVHNGATALAGIDVDGDRLGSGLESLLRSCDSVGTPPYFGVSCSSRPGCATSPTGTLCRQSLRDSDGDGLRDDLELYGVPLYVGLSYVGGGELPRFGADPAHYDLFVEVDYQGDSFNVTTNACDTMVPEGYPPIAPTGRLTPLFASRMAAQFRITTAAHLPNRDGSAGIWAHFDTGVAAATPTDTTSGNWGGSNCYPYRPFCSVDAQCLGTGGSCCTASGGCTQPDGEVVPPGRCNTFDRRAHEMSPQRRAFFHSFFRIPGGGASDVCAPFGYAAVIGSIVHEMGHMACLEHSGPNNVGLGDEFNNRVNHLSRINYTYTFVGGATFGGTDATRMSFSNGELPDLRPLAVAENCPFGSSPNYDLINSWSVSHFGRVDLFPACPRIDWNLDGVFETSSSTTVEARLGSDRVRSWREVAQPGEWVAESGPDLVVAGNVLRRFRIAAPFAWAQQTLRYATGTSYACAEAPQAGTVRFPSCAFLGTTEVTVDTGGAVSRPVAVGADSTTTSGTNTVVVWRTAAGGLRSGLLTSGGTWTLNPLMTGVPTLASQLSGNGMPSVARIAGTSSVLLMYRNSVGALIEQVGTVSGATITWTAPVTVTAIVNDGTIAGSPALTAADGTLVADGNLLLIGQNTGSAFSLRIWRRTAAGVWSLLNTVADTTPDAMWGRGDITIRPFRIGAGLSRRVLVSWRPALSAQVRVRLGPANSVTGPFGGTLPWIDGFVHGYLMDMEYDTRATTGASGVRGIWGDYAGGGCGTGCPAGSQCTTLSGGTVGAPVACVTLEGLLFATERRPPAADGVIPMTSEDFDEWRMLRHAYCAVLRDQNMLYAASPYREDRTSCEPVPDYGL